MSTYIKLTSIKGEPFGIFDTINDVKSEYKLSSSTIKNIKKKLLTNEPVFFYFGFDKIRVEQRNE